MDDEDEPEPWPDLAGRLIAGGHVLPVRIYFEDTDFSGVVYHGSYLRFMERGRSDFSASSASATTRSTPGEWRAARLRRAAHRRSISSSRRGSTISIEVDDHGQAKSAARASMLAQTVTPRGESWLTEAEVTIVLVNREGKARRIPDRSATRLSRGGRGGVELTLR